MGTVRCHNPVAADIDVTDIDFVDFVNWLPQIYDTPGH